ALSYRTQCLARQFYIYKSKVWRLDKEMALVKRVCRTAAIMVLSSMIFWGLITYFTLQHMLEDDSNEPFNFISTEEDVNYTEGRVASLDLENATVLITGIAGFIGYSVASKLLDRETCNIVGVDNFNDYYDVSLKYKRADLLSYWDKVRIIEGDACNATLMRNVLEEYKVTHVLHLAAQAGVRYSLENPLTYVRNNIQCFVVLLEELRRVKANSENGFVPHLVYASSSSVYGGNKKVPFEEIDPVENPSSLYGLTKRVNELLALVYSRNFGISSLGLRFFTVYGPWGRPDMAPYKFTESILKGGNITVFNHGKMARDFTYIDDIVSGISAALEYQPSSPLILNLGHGNPENVLDLVKIIENYTGRPAKLQFMESIVDLPLTSASVKKAKKLLSYSPRVSLREGMQS
ncbi:UDP-glucuronate 4-epimerase, partial [Nannochloropsis gaditana CCMP526]